MVWCAVVFRPQIRIENYETHIGPLCSPIGTSACPIGQHNSLTIGGNSPTSASNGDDCPKIPIFMTKPLARLSANNLRCPGVNKSKSVDLCLFSYCFSSPIDFRCVTATESTLLVYFLLRRPFRFFPNLFWAAYIFSISLKTSE